MIIIFYIILGLFIFWLVASLAYILLGYINMRKINYCCCIGNFIILFLIFVAIIVLYIINFVNIIKIFNNFSKIKSMLNIEVCDEYTNELIQILKEKEENSKNYNIYLTIIILNSILGFYSLLFIFIVILFK